MALRTEQSQRLSALFALGVLLFTYPLLAVFNREGSVFGIPLLYAYLFGAWAVLIALLALAARIPAAPAAPSPGGPPPSSGQAPP